MARSKNNIKRRGAFKAYYEMGDERSYEKVGELFNVSKTTIYLWAREDKWQERLNKIEAEEIRKETEKMDKEILEDKLKYRKILKAAISVYANQIKNDKTFKISSKDFAKFIELDLSIQDKLDHGTADKFSKLKDTSKEKTETHETSDTLNNLYEILKSKVDGKE